MHQQIALTHGLTHVLSVITHASRHHAQYVCREVKQLRQLPQSPGERALTLFRHCDYQHERLCRASEMQMTSICAASAEL